MLEANQKHNKMVEMLSDLEKQQQQQQPSPLHHTQKQQQEFNGQQNLHSPSTSSSNKNSPLIPIQKYTLSDHSTHQHYVDSTSSSGIIEDHSYPEKKEGTISSSSHAIAKANYS